MTIRPAVHSRIEVNGAVKLMAAFLLTAVEFALLLSPARAHDIYPHLTDRSGRPCCNGGDCRPAMYRKVSSGVEMLVAGQWVWVPEARIQYRHLDGDTGETGGAHWCGEAYDGGHITYCAFLPPSLSSAAQLAPQLSDNR